MSSFSLFFIAVAIIYTYVDHTILNIFYVIRFSFFTGPIVNQATEL